MSRRLAVAVFLFAVSGSSFAQCVSSLYPQDRAASLCVTSSDPFISASVISAGVGMWGVCGSTGIPQLNANSSSCTFTFNVIHISGVSTSATGGCGEFRPSFDNTHTPPTINGGTIVVWDVQQNGVDCEAGRSATIAHELGHGLGLGDSSCQGYIMGPPQAGGGGISVQSDECQQADSLWTTPSETTPPRDPDPCGFSCQEGRGADSPIVINLGKGGYRLSGADDPVLFDISATGQAFWIGWTAAGGDEAFLCLDRDGDGAIANGTELFGNATPLRTGQRASNGFIALAEYDANGDGIIDDRDAVWGSLLLWTDRNHDGVSQPSEIVKIDSSPVLAIALDAHWTGRRDVSGNTFRFESTVWISNGKGEATARPVYDVFFVRAP
ncbi:MAG TPA: hypothetical protein VI670_26665 [Thermoanaerobaculia bacterium]|jgi:hypothetical protein